MKRRPDTWETARKLLQAEGRSPDPFSRAWIERSGGRPETARANDQLLKELGFTDKMIVRKAELLSLPTTNIRRNWQFLMKLGVSRHHVTACPELLALNPKTLRARYRGLRNLSLTPGRGTSSTLIRNKAVILYRRPETLRLNHAFLKGKGLSDRKIATNLMLLGRDKETLEDNWRSLNKIGLTDRQIITNAHLLSPSKNTVTRNYANLRRFFGRDTILKLPGLLSLGRDTAEANVQLLAFLGIPLGRNLLTCLTTPKKKRMKLAWLMKNVFDQVVVTDRVGAVKSLVRKYPRTLVFSLAKLERMKESLQEKALASEGVRPEAELIDRLPRLGRGTA